MTYNVLCGAYDSAKEKRTLILQEKRKGKVNVDSRKLYLDYMARYANLQVWNPILIISKHCKTK